MQMQLAAAMAEVVLDVVAGLHVHEGPSLVVNGFATGVDSMQRIWRAWAVYRPWYSVLHVNSRHMIAPLSR